MVQTTVEGSNTIITFSYTSPTAKITQLADEAAHGLYDKGAGNHGTEEEPVVYADLSNSDKLDILDNYVKNGLLAEANSYASNAAQATARETAEENKIEL